MLQWPSTIQQLSSSENGDGTFKSPAVPLTIGSVPAITDFNVDGRDDLAVFGYGGLIGIFLGNGDGSFAGPVSHIITGIKLAC